MPVAFTTGRTRFTTMFAKATPTAATVSSMPGAASRWRLRATTKGCADSAAGAIMDSDSALDSLNDAQRAAVLHGIHSGEASLDPDPMLVIAGAGSGKTSTLAHRVAELIHGGVDPRRILLLTFSRRAAAEMTRRASQILAASRSSEDEAFDAPPRARDGNLQWSGTFHAIANRILRLYAEARALDPTFKVLDRSDSADLLDWLRDDLGLAKRERRFPKKGTCLSVYSHTVNAQCDLSQTFETAYPWCADWEEELRTLRAFAERLELSLSPTVRMLCIHGSPTSFDENLLATTPDFEIAEALRGFDQDVIVGGHTHVQMHRRVGRQLLVNAGSVGMPFERFVIGEPPTILPWAEYAIVRADARGLRVELRRVDYDIDEFKRRCLGSAMPDPEGWIAAWK